MNFSGDHWDFEFFYSDKPDTDLFFCRAVVAGAVSIYLDVVTEKDNKGSKTINKGSLERVINIFNAFLKKTSEQKKEGLLNFNPFKYDVGLESSDVDANVRNEYKERLKSFLKAFQSKYEVFNCVEILGFDPFRYEEYDEATQESIEEGEWMQKCTDCMRSIVEDIYVSKNRNL